jgi:tetratricopeptide (TPR) repeat protein
MSQSPAEHPDAAQLAALLAQARHAVDPERRRDCLLRAAALQEQLGDPEAALATLEQLPRGERDPEVSTALTRVHEELARRHERAGRWGDLASSLRAQLELAEDRASKVALDHRLGALWHHRLDEPLRALMWYREALRLDPGHADTLAAVRALAQGAGSAARAAARLLAGHGGSAVDPAQMARTLEATAAGSSSASDRVSALLALAQLCDGELAQPRKALAACGRALRLAPTSELVHEQLERLVEKTSQWGPLVELYERVADGVEEPAVRAALYRRAAAAAEGRLGDAARAEALYSKALAAGGLGDAAAEALAALYERTGRHRELCVLLERRLAAGAGPAAELHCALARCLAQEFGDVPAALAQLRAALAADPQHGATLALLEDFLHEGGREEDLIELLEPVYRRTGAYEQLHTLLSIRLGRTVEPPARRALLSELADIAEQELGDLPQAFVWWRAAAREQPDFEAAFDHCERLAIALCAECTYIELIEAALQAGAPLTILVPRLVRAARIQEEVLDDPGGAILTYQRILALDEHDQTALGELERLYVKNRRTSELLRLLEQRAQKTQDLAEKAALHIQRAAIYDRELGEDNAALAAYAHALDCDPGNRAALLGQAAIYEERQQLRNLLAVHEKLADLGSAEEARTEHRRMAALATQLGDCDRAIALWQELLATEGEQEDALRELATLQERTRQWQDLVQTLLRLIAVARSDREIIALYRRLGRLWLRELDQPRAAIDAFLCAHRLDEEDRDTLEALLSLYRDIDSPIEVAQTLRRLIALEPEGADPTRLLRLWGELADVESSLPGRDHEAAAALREVLALAPDDAQAAAALQVLLARTGDFAALAAHLEQRIATCSDGPAAVPLWLELGQIREQEAGQVPAAVAAYERVRALAPGHPLALERLEQLYVQSRDFRRAVAVQRERAEHSQGAERQRHLAAAARLLTERLGEAETALPLWLEAWRCAPEAGAEECGAALARLAGRSFQWSQLLAAARELAQGLSPGDGPAAAAVWRAVAGWYSQHLDSPGEAAAALREALRCCPGDLGALELLASIQRQRGAWIELAATLEEQTRAEHHGDRRVAIYLQLAGVYLERLHDPERAIATYQRALQLRPELPQALEPLATLLRRRKDHRALAAVLPQLIASADEATALALSLELGCLYSRQLDEPDLAIEVLRRVLAQRPQHPEALGELERVYEQRGLWAELVDTIDARARRATTTSEQVGLYQRAADVCELRLGDLGRAAAFTERICQLAPRHADAYRNLARLHGLAGDFEEAARAYRRQLEVVESGPARAEILCLLARLFETELDRPESALAALEAARKLAPDDEQVLAGLARLYDVCHQPAQAVAALEALAAQVQSPLEEAELHHQAGLLRLRKLGDAHGAEDAFERALACDPHHVPTLLELTTLRSAQGQWHKAAQLLARAAGLRDSVVEKVRLHYFAARIYLDRLQRVDEAETHLAAVLALDPEHVAAARPLARIYETSGNWQALEPVLALLLRHARGESSRSAAAQQQLVELLCSAGRCDRALGKYDAALERYAAVLAIEPTSVAALLGRADTLRERGDLADAARGYQTALVCLRGGDSREHLHAYQRLGEVYQALDQPGHARHFFDKALEIDPRYRPALEALIELHLAAGDFAAVVRARMALVAIAGPAERARILTQIGDLHRDQLGQRAEAIRCYQQALEYAPRKHRLLQNLLDLHAEAGDWSSALSCIERFIDIESSPLRRASYHRAAGSICADKLHDRDRALDHHQRALDSCFAHQPASGAAIERALAVLAEMSRLLDRPGDGARLETLLRRVLRQIPAGHPGLPALWHRLGLLYSEVLGRPDTAIQAFEVAHRLEPDDPARRQRLSELYLGLGEDQRDKAIALHAQVLQGDPRQVASLRALGRIYLDAGQHDKVLCVCRTLMHLGAAEPDEIEHVARHGRPGSRLARDTLTDELLRQLEAPEQDRLLSAILALLWREAAHLRAHSPRSLGLHREARIDIAGDISPLAELLRHAAQVLGVALPAVFRLPDGVQPLRVASTLRKGEVSPTVVVSQRALDALDRPGQRFAAARVLHLLRPHNYPTLVYEADSELGELFLCAALLVRDDQREPAGRSPGESLRRPLLTRLRRYLRPAQRERLEVLVGDWLARGGASNPGLFRRGVDASANRAGLLYCDDLDAAVRLVRRSPSFSGLSTAAAVDDLLAFSVSEAYFELRQHLGLASDGDQPVEPSTRSYGDTGRIGTPGAAPG